MCLKLQGSSTDSICNSAQGECIIPKHLYSTIVLTPSPYGHSPYIPLRKHRGRGGLTLLLPLQVFLIPLLVATLLSSPLYFALQNAGEECRNLSITWFYCFYSPAVLPCSILCVATPVRLRDTAREECVNVLQCRGV